MPRRTPTIAQLNELRRSRAAPTSTVSVLPFRGKTRPKQRTELDSYKIAVGYLVGGVWDLRAGAVCEVEWRTFRPYELHALELTSGKVILRYVKPGGQIGTRPLLELHGGDATDRVLIPANMVKRIGLVLRASRCVDGTWTEVHKRTGQRDVKDA